MSGNIFNPTLAGLRRTLDLRMQQHGLTSANLANADTPEFKAKHVDFKAAFERIFADGGDGGVSMRRANARHLSGITDDGGAVPVVEQDAPAWSQDGNSVNADHEMAALAQNNILYNATIDAMSRKLALLEYAASDGGK